MKDLAEFSPGIDNAHRRVFYALREAATEALCGEGLWVGVAPQMTQAALSKRAGVDRRSVGRALRMLEQHALICVCREQRAVLVYLGDGDPAEAQALAVNALADQPQRRRRSDAIQAAA